MKFVSGLLACMFWGAEGVSEKTTPQCDDRTSCDNDVDSEDFALLALKRSAIIMNNAQRQSPSNVCGTRPGQNSNGVNLYPSANTSGNAAQCCAKCKIDVRCDHWTFIRGNNECWLKQGGPIWTQDSTVTSGSIISPTCGGRTGQNSNGNNLYRVPQYAHSAGACCDSCKIDALCTHWTFTRRNSGCWLKSGSPTWTPDSGVTSGAIISSSCGARAGQNSGGDNLFNSASRLSDAAQCCDQCTNTAGCAHWTFVHGNNECWLKGGSPVWTPDSAVTSGSVLPFDFDVAR